MAWLGFVGGGTCWELFQSVSGGARPGVAERIVSDAELFAIGVAADASAGASSSGRNVQVPPISFVQDVDYVG
jgi:hypothetical protein